MSGDAGERSGKKQIPLYNREDAGLSLVSKESRCPAGPDRGKSLKEPLNEESR
jgi:hypothetical protein